ncbi:MAG: response regulator [Elusimicrobiota bacterium]
MEQSDPPLAQDGKPDIPGQPSVGARIVVADDQDDLLALMQDALEMEGYEVRAASNGQDALDFVLESPPDLVILDLWMPMKNGFEVCQALKENPLSQHLPVILLSGAADLDNKVQGLELGADDFVTKPVNLIELLARIRMILKRTKQSIDANPLTKMPGNASIQNKIAERISRGGPLAILYLDLNNFKAYNDVYGFAAGDQVLKTTGKLILDTVHARGAEGDFIGHIGGDDFIVVTNPDKMELLADVIISEYDRIVPSFYKEEDARRGKIIAKDRRGETVEYPLLGIAIGICHNSLKPLTSHAQVSQLGAELKKHAKSFGGSKHFIDRRKD